MAQSGDDHNTKAEAVPIECGKPGCCAPNLAQEASIAERIETVLRAQLQATHVEVIDESSGCGARLTIVVVSQVFDTKPLLAQHRLVNKVAADLLSQVHAFTIKTYTPAKWAQL